MKCSIFYDHGWPQSLRQLMIDDIQAWFFLHKPVLWLLSPLCYFLYPTSQPYFNHGKSLLYTDSKGDNHIFCYDFHSFRGGNFPDNEVTSITFTKGAFLVFLLGINDNVLVAITWKRGLDKPWNRMERVRMNMGIWLVSKASGGVTQGLVNQSS